MQPISMSDADHRDSDRRENRKRELISQEAAEWFARMKDPHVPLDDRRRFLRWLKQSQVHVAEYLTVAGVDGDLRRAQLSLVLAAGVPSNVVPLFARESEAPTAASTVAPTRWKVAAAIAACALATLLFLGVRTAWYERSIETELGEWKTVTLADGSELQLGPNTRVTLDLGDAQRSIGLERGEAYFKVAKGEARPFIVEANSFAVRAVGTEFEVSRRKDELIVTVVEGVVRVAPRARPVTSHNEELPELSVPLTADQQLRISSVWPVSPTRVDIDYELAWRKRKLVFREGDTLAGAIDEFNRRNQLQLSFDPTVPATLPVRGTFDASNPTVFAQTMARASKLRVLAPSANTLRLIAE
jgi:transmembrane sensor